MTQAEQETRNPPPTDSFSGATDSEAANQENIRDGGGSSETTQTERRWGASYGQLSRWVNSLRWKVERRDEQLRRQEEKYHSMEERHEREIAGLRKQNSDLQGEIASLKRLLQTRTSELDDAQTYLTTTDPHSHADIVRLVEDVNNAIFHSAATIADSLKWESRPTAPGPFLQVPEREKAVRDIGLSTVELLEHGDHSQDPICVQIALQAYMAKLAKWLVSTWSMGFSEREEGILSEVYRQIRTTETSSIAGRWRSLTCQHLRRSGELSSTQLNAYFVRRIGIVLSLSGYRGSDTNVIEAVNDFEGKITDVVEHCLQLRTAIGQDVVSCFFEVYLPKAGSQFTTKTMQDAYGESECAQPREGDTSPSAVLCPVALGLRKENPLQAPGGNNEPEMIPTLRAKVVLQSTMEELLGMT